MSEVSCIQRRADQFLIRYALNFWVDKQIGSGAFRRVYSLGSKEMVLKLEYSGKEFCNVLEAKVWWAVKDTPLEEWFAPVIDIDHHGRRSPHDADQAVRQRGGVQGAQIAKTRGKASSRPSSMMSTTATSECSTARLSATTTGSTTSSKRRSS
jgi:hypothetical protein